MRIKQIVVKNEIGRDLFIPDIFIFYNLNNVTVSAVVAKLFVGFVGRCASAGQQVLNIVILSLDLDINR